MGTDPEGADWGDRVGGLKGVACGHLRDADEDVGVPGDTAQTTDHEVIVTPREGDDVDASNHADCPQIPSGLSADLEAVPNRVPLANIRARPGSIGRRY